MRKIGLQIETTVAPTKVNSMTASPTCLTDKTDFDAKQEQRIFGNCLQELVYAVEGRNVQRIAAISDALNRMYFERLMEPTTSLTWSIGIVDAEGTALTKNRYKRFSQD